MAIKGVLFDKDGTLIEVNATWVPLYRDMLKTEFGHSPEEIEDMLQRGGYEPSTGVFRAGSTLAAGGGRTATPQKPHQISAEGKGGMLSYSIACERARPCARPSGARRTPLPTRLSPPVGSTHTCSSFSKATSAAT